jgi:hypothetical protein
MHGGRRDNRKKRDDDRRGGVRTPGPGKKLGRPKKMTKHITSYLNQAGDIEVSITLLESGNYAVRVYDVAETLPASRHFKTEEAAKAYAIKCATSGDTDELPF